MNEKYANALVQSVARQRDQALNAAAQFEAQIAVLQAENAALSEENTKLKAPKAEPADATPQ